MTSFADVKKEYGKNKELKKEHVQLLRDWVMNEPHLPEISVNMSFSTFTNVEKEYEKNKDLKKEDIQLLQEWVAQQPHLPKISELFLILFWHRNYFNIEGTKRSINTFYAMRACCPEIFSNRRPSLNPGILEQALYTPLPIPTRQGYRIMFWKFINPNPENMVFEDLTKSFDLAALLMLHQTGTALGYIVLIDLAGMTPGHITKLTPLEVKKMLVYLQEALPIRLKNIIFINIPPYMEDYFAIVRPCLKKDVLDKVEKYGDNLEEVFHLIPQECLPSDYGGKVDSIEELIRKRNETLLAYENFLEEEEKEISDEFKRMGKPWTLDDIFGGEYA